MSNDRTIHVPVLARVEGEGALELELVDNKISSVHLRIYEPPRMFEKFLEGRSWSEVPDTVARICGICPVAYQMSAVHAIERAFDIDPGPWVREMRRLFYCGEWLESHSLHIHMLATPDFMGFSSVIELAQEYPEEVKRGLKLQAIGNDLVAMLGARSVHPVGARVGGFHHAPSMQEVEAMLVRLHEARPEAEALVKWIASIKVPEDEQAFTSVSLRHSDEYPMNEGSIISSAGLDIAINEYEQHFRELHQPHSTALHSLLEDKPYLVGPLARLNLNLDRLPEATLTLLKETGIQIPSANMFHSVLARAIEIHYAVGEAIRILESYVVPDSPYVEVTTHAGVGYGCTEAPRGILWHRYELDGDGNVMMSRIVPPTSQNQARIEEDLRNSLERFGLQHSDDELRLHGEMVIRNYDPCISCATHFLKLTVNRG
jgi:coenzyme F420-reducing hydrogenase alpha subunit